MGEKKCNNKCLAITIVNPNIVTKLHVSITGKNDIDLI